MNYLSYSSVSNQSPRKFKQTSHALSFLSLKTVRYRVEKANDGWWHPVPVKDEVKG